MLDSELTLQVVDCVRDKRLACWHGSVISIAFLLLNACGGLLGSDSSTSNMSAGGQSNSAGGTGHSGGAGITETIVNGGATLIPADTRNTSLLWRPASSLGTPGWRQSTVRFCDTHKGESQGYSVWADTRGVYALVNMGCRPSDMTTICVGTEGWGLQFNDGSGWRSETLIAGDTGVNINDMWGISKNEVFLAVQESQMPDDPCGGNTLVWYDGATFHQL